MSIPSLTTPTSSSSCSTALSDCQSNAEKLQQELEIIKSWFSLLDEEERTAAFKTIAETTLVREIEPLIQTLKERKRGLWREQEKLAMSCNYRGKHIIPPFPLSTTDPNWLRRWLRALRLHKYQNNLEGLSPTEVAGLTDEGLQRLGIDTLGARKKLIRVSYFVVYRLFIIDADSEQAIGTS